MVQIRHPLPQHGPLVKRLRHGPFTAVTWVRFPYGSPKKTPPNQGWCFSFLWRSSRDRPTLKIVRFSGYGFESQPRRLPWRPRKTRLIPVQKQTDSLSICFYFLGALYLEVEQTCGYCGSAEKLHKIRTISGICTIWVTRAPHSRILVYRSGWCKDIITLVVLIGGSVSSPVSLRLGHLLGGTVINCFLMLILRFAPPEILHDEADFRTLCTTEPIFVRVT